MSLDSILELSLPELTETLVGHGQKPYRAKQILQWIWKKNALDFADMTNLSADLRAQLDEEFTVLRGVVVREAESSDGAVKLLIEWPDGARIETVAIPAKDRLTACVSTQAGCAFRCAFCASGSDGLERNLTGAEILEQVLHVAARMSRPVTNVVFMGSGEPLANYDATVAAVRGLTDPDRAALGARRVVVSTVGLPEPIRRLSREGISVRLAISIHAPNDALRSKLMPVAGEIPLKAIFHAAEAYALSRRREVTLEYTLLAGVNDSPTCAEQLARWAGRLRCNVNLICYNSVSSVPFGPPGEAVVLRFAEQLRQRGLGVNIRVSRGADAQAACGQLRRIASRMK